MRRTNERTRVASLALFRSSRVTNRRSVPISWRDFFVFSGSRPSRRRPPIWGRRDAMARLVFDGSRSVEMKVEGYRALMKDLICQGGHFRESSIVNRTQLRKDLPKDSRGNPGSCFFPRRVKHGTRMERSVVESRQRSKSRGRGAVSSRPVVVVAGRGVVLGGDDHGDGG